MPVAGARLRLRPPGARPAGRLRHRHGHPHRVRHRPGRDRHVHRRLRRGARPVRDHQRLAGLPRLLRDLHRHPPLGRRRGAQGDARHHRDRGRRPGRVRDRHGARASTRRTCSTSPPPTPRAPARSCRSGCMGILAASRYAIWFFLAVEGVPLAAEEARDPKRDMPRGIIGAMVVLLVFAALMLVFAPGAAGSAVHRGLGQPAAARRPHRVRRRHLARPVRQLRRPRRAGRQLLLDHLRLLAACCSRCPAPATCRAALSVTNGRKAPVPGADRARRPSASCSPLTGRARC